MTAHMTTQDHINKLCDEVLRQSFSVVTWETIQNILIELKKRESHLLIRKFMTEYTASLLLKCYNERAGYLLEGIANTPVEMGFPGIVLICFKEFKRDS